MQQQARPRQALDRERILAAALDFVDTHGLDALSMRKLGAQLGVEAMAIYYHVPSKAALVEGMLGLVFAQLALPSADSQAPWQDVIRGVARSFRHLGLAHPNLFSMLSTVGFDNPATLRPAECVLEVLSRAGLGLADAFTAFISLKSYVVGHTLWAIGEPAPQVCDTFPELPAADYPNLAGAAEAIGARAVATEFELGLDLIIQGIEARLAPR
jgi:TetR/AcrR family tetracycline transcriptional repressor